MIQDPILRILLAPFSLLYGIGVGVRDFLYSKRLLLSFKFDLPVISVGNLSVGGAGKTPHTEYLIRLLQPYLEVATLSRGYRRTTTGFRVVNETDTVEEAGDEPLMFKQKFPDVLVAVSEQRAMGIPMIVQQKPDTQVVLLDDAFQHRAVKPGLNILLTEFKHPFTRDHLLPSGRLREWRSAYQRADLIIVTKCPEDLTSQEKDDMAKEINPFPHQQIFFSSYRYLKPYPIFGQEDNKDEPGINLIPDQQISSTGWSRVVPLWPDVLTFRQTTPKPPSASPALELDEELSVLMFCAIAGTDYMQDYLESKVGTVRVKAFADHHYFDEMDLEELWKIFEAMPGTRKCMVTTEKDAMRLHAHKEWIIEKQIPLLVLPVEVVFHFDGKTRFDQAIKQFLLDFRA